MDLGLDGQVVIVTGGASNIGKATSIEFAREGATVAILDRDEAMGKATAAQITESGGSAVFYPLDLTDVDATAAVAASVEADLGPVAALVNNVGWNGPAEFFLNLGPERWDKAYRLNLFPTLNATKAELPKATRLEEIDALLPDGGILLD